MTLPTSHRAAGVNTDYKGDLFMALQSALFRGDAKLEAAAASDPAHIVEGAVGPHVTKIQQALIQLDGATLIKDGIYGPKTAAAVLAYKRKRNIVNRSFQTQADNIVGKMTIAAFDKEMLAKEGLRGPILIRHLHPAPSVTTPGALVGPATLLLGFKIDVDDPLPGGAFQKIRLTPRSTADLEIVNGGSGTIRCRNITPKGDCHNKTCFLFDPTDPQERRRINPEPVGSRGAQEDGGKVAGLKDQQRLRLDAFRPGDAFIDATTGTSFATLIAEVRAPKLGPVKGSPFTKTRPGSKFITGRDTSQPDPANVFHGRPVNPIGTGRKINLAGEQETPGFEDYSVNLPFSGYSRSFTGNLFVFRPLTEDSDPAVGVQNGEATDICARGVLIKDETIFTIKRIAAGHCRFTYSGNANSLARVKQELGGIGFIVIEEFLDESEIVMER